MGLDGEQDTYITNAKALTVYQRRLIHLQKSVLLMIVRSDLQSNPRLPTTRHIMDSE